MKPRLINEHDREMWAELHPREFTFTSPDEIEAGIHPCQALVTDDPQRGRGVVRVPWQPDEDDIARIVAGGTIWLSTYAALPVHSLMVDNTVKEMRQ